MSEQGNKTFRNFDPRQMPSEYYEGDKTSWQLLYYKVCYRKGVTKHEE